MGLRIWAWTGAVLAAASVAAQTPAPVAPTPGALAAAPAGPVSATPLITARARLVGKPPVLPPLRPGPDPACAKSVGQPGQEILLGKWNALQNVLVYVSKGAPPGPGKDLQLTQQECLVRPRIAAVTAGNLVRFVNADATTHSLHVYAGTRTLMNELVPADAPTTAKDFSEQAGQVLRVQCDLHPTGTAYVHVLPTAAFAVTNDQGVALLPDLPPGQYTLTAWHERLGVRTAEVTTETGRPAEVMFSFASPEPARPGARPGE